MPRHQLMESNAIYIFDIHILEYEYECMNKKKQEWKSLMKLIKQLYGNDISLKKI